MRLYLLTLIALLIAANSVRAAQTSDDVVAPWVSPYTLVIIRFDVDRIDENALADVLIDAVKEPAMDAPMRQMLRDWWKQWFDIGDGPMADFRKAGVRRVYWLLTLPDVVDPHVQMGTWIFPIEENADALKVMEISRGHRLTAEHIGQVVVAAPSGQSLGAGNGQALPPAWEHALADGDDAPIRAAIVPPAILRKSFEENLPSFPTPAGPEPITVLTRGIEWAGISVTLAPQPHARMTIQALDAAAAGNVANLLGRALPNFESLLPQYGPSLSLFQSALAHALKPTVVADQLRWDTEFQSVLAPIIARDLRQAVRTRSASKMRQILQSLLVYASNHKGQTRPTSPRSLKTMTFRRTSLSIRLTWAIRSASFISVRWAIGRKAATIRRCCTRLPPMDLTLASPTGMSIGLARENKLMSR